MMETVAVGEHTVKTRGSIRGMWNEVPCPSTNGYVDTIRTRQHVPNGADQAVEVCCEACRQHFLVIFKPEGDVLGITKMRN